MYRTTLIHGDHKDWLLEMKGKVDLIITSPPFYGMLDHIDEPFHFGRAAGLIADSLKDGGVLCWNTFDAVIDGSYTGNSMRQVLTFMSPLGLNLWETIIRAKNPRMPRGHKRHRQNWEYVYILSKGSPNTANILKDHPSNSTYRYGIPTGLRKGGSETLDAKHFRTRRYNTTKRTTIWKIGYSTKYPSEHQAGFPVQLAEDLIKTYSEEGDLVLDPMCGSGSTNIAALLHNRKSIGIDINKDYIYDAKQRINQAFPEYDNLVEVIE